MSKYSGFYATLVCAMCCSTAFAIQPTVRAGSLSFSGNVKNTSTTASQPTTTTAATTATTTAGGASVRGSALSKLSRPITANINNYTSGASSEELEELRQQLEALTRTQLTRTAVEDIVDDETADIRRSLSNLNTSNQDIQTSLATLQGTASELTTGLNSRIDERVGTSLYGLGVVDRQNNLAVARKSDVQDLTSRVSGLSTKVDGGINDQGSLLYTIKNNQDIQNVLRGPAGDAADATAVATALKRDSSFLNTVKGDTGPQGPQGPAGTSASATDVATILKNDSVFRAQVKGDRGPQGESGADVNAGDVAVLLLNNSNFVNSLKGPKGDTGAKGDTGPQGPAGTSPSAADVAYTLQGNSAFLAAVKGQKGDKGDRGETGATGPAGQSASASEIANTLKNDTSFIALTKGAKGDRGETGATGPAGQSASATDVANVLKADSAFKLSVKGDTGPQGPEGPAGDASAVATTLLGDNNFISSIGTRIGVPDADDIAAELTNNQDFKDALLEGIEIPGGASVDQVINALDFRVQNTNNETRLCYKDANGSTQCTNNLKGADGTGSIDPDQVASELLGNQDFKDAIIAGVGSVGGASVSDVITQLDLHTETPGNEIKICYKDANGNPQCTNNLKGADGTGSIDPDQVASELLGNQDFKDAIIAGVGSVGGASVDDVVNALDLRVNTSENGEDVMLCYKKSDGSSECTANLRGPQGQAGSGITFRGSVTNYSGIQALGSSEKKQGYAWYNNEDGKMYIATCDANGQNCVYPARGQGADYRGQDGETPLYTVTDNEDGSHTICFSTVSRGQECYTVTNGSTGPAGATAGELWCNAHATSTIFSFTKSIRIMAACPGTLTGFVRANSGLIPKFKFSGIDSCKTSMNDCEALYDTIVGGTSAADATLEAKINDYPDLAADFDSVEKLDGYATEEYIGDITGPSASDQWCAANAGCSTCSHTYLSVAKTRAITDILGTNHAVFKVLTGGDHVNQGYFNSDPGCRTVMNSNPDVYSIVTSGTEGATAIELWCEANWNKPLPFAKTVRIKSLSNGSMVQVPTSGEFIGRGRFASKEDCIAALSADNNVMFAEILSGTSVSDEEVNKQYSLDTSSNKTNTINAYGTLAKLNNWATSGFKATLVGTGIQYKGQLDNYTDLENIDDADRVQGNAWYVKETGMMYILTCDSNNNCTFPAKENGALFRGEDGATGFSPEFSQEVLENGNRRICFTTVNGINCFEVTNGTNGSSAGELWCESQWNTQFSLSKSIRIQNACESGLTGFNRVNNSAAAIKYAFNSKANCKTSMNNCPGLFAEVISGIGAADAYVDANQETLDADENFDLDEFATEAYIGNITGPSASDQWCNVNAGSSTSTHTYLSVAKTRAVVLALNNNSTTNSDSRFTVVSGSGANAGKGYFNNKATCREVMNTFPSVYSIVTNGENGVTFTPVLTTEGMLSFNGSDGSTISGVSIKGPQGDPGLSIAPSTFWCQYNAETTTFPYSKALRIRQIIGLSNPNFTTLESDSSRWHFVSTDACLTEMSAHPSLFGEVISGVSAADAYVDANQEDLEADDDFKLDDFATEEYVGKVTGDSASDQWCDANARPQSNNPTYLSVTKTKRVTNMIGTGSGFVVRPSTATDHKNQGYFDNIRTCKTLMNNNPGLYLIVSGGESASDILLNKKIGDTPALISEFSTAADLDNYATSAFIGDITGPAGATAVELWCEANWNKPLPFAKTVRMKSLINNSAIFQVPTSGTNLGQGRFSSEQDCITAMSANSYAAFIEALNGTSSADDALNKRFNEASNKTEIINLYGTLQNLNDWQSVEYPASLKGDAGTGITYRGQVNTYSELASKQKIQGHAYYNKADGRMYIVTCDNDGVSNCQFPANGNGALYKGDAGTAGFSPEFSQEILENGDRKICFSTADGNENCITISNGINGTNGSSAGELWCESQWNTQFSLSKSIRIQNACESGLAGFNRVGNSAAAIKYAFNSKANCKTSMTNCPGLFAEVISGIGAADAYVDANQETLAADENFNLDEFATSAYIGNVTGPSASQQWCAGNIGQSHALSVSKTTRVKAVIGTVGGTVGFVEKSDGTGYFNNEVKCVQLMETYPALYSAVTGGDNGVTFTPVLTTEGLLSFNGDDGTTIPGVNVKGANGITYTPSVSTAGVLSFTPSDGGAVINAGNVKGPKGDSVTVTSITNGVRVCGYDSNGTLQCNDVVNGEDGDDGDSISVNDVLPDLTQSLFENDTFGNAVQLTPTTQNGKVVLCHKDLKTQATVCDDTNIKGNDGVTYTPSVSNGILSFTPSNGGAVINAGNVKGDAGQSPTVTVSEVTTNGRTGTRICVTPVGGTENCKTVYNGTDGNNGNDGASVRVDDVVAELKDDPGFMDDLRVYPEIKEDEGKIYVCYDDVCSENIKGADGADGNEGRPGTNGADGKSAADQWCEQHGTVSNKFTIKKSNQIMTTLGFDANHIPDGFQMTASQLYFVSSAKCKTLMSTYPELYSLVNTPILQASQLSTGNGGLKVCVYPVIGNGSDNDYCNNITNGQDGANGDNIDINEIANQVLASDEFVEGFGDSVAVTTEEGEDPETGKLVAKICRLDFKTQEKICEPIQGLVSIGDFNDLSGSVGNLNTSFGTLNGTVTGLNTNLGTLTTNFNTLNGKAITDDNIDNKITAKGIITTGNLASKGVATTQNVADAQAAAVVQAKNQLITMSDLVNYINAGMFQVSNGAVVLNTNLNTANATSAELTSLNKLRGAGDSSNSSHNFGSNFGCTVNGCGNDYELPANPNP